jgi:hypothetical protein
MQEDAPEAIVAAALRFFGWRGATTCTRHGPRLCFGHVTAHRKRTEHCANSTDRLARTRLPHHRHYLLSCKRRFPWNKGEMPRFRCCFAPRPVRITSSTFVIRWRRRAGDCTTSMSGRPQNPTIRCRREFSIFETAPALTPYQAAVALKSMWTIQARAGTNHL